MKQGALFFLTGFLALAGSWFGMVLVPQLQVGRADVTKDQYPSRRPGLAEQGAQVYRANGCAACHSQQVRQSGTVFDFAITEVGTNAPGVIAALKTVNNKLDAAALSALPLDVLVGVKKQAVADAEKVFKKTGATLQTRVRPVGPDMERGWGKRANVGQDYLQDSPVMIGSQRLGPDLANIGSRNTDENWHIHHLYAPSSKVPGSTMPAYRFLFEKRKIGRHASPDALVLEGALKPEAGFEIVPTDKARALVAYLKSLRSDAALFEAPMTVAAPVEAATTNAPAK